LVDHYWRVEEEKKKKADWRLVAVGVGGTPESAAASTLPILLRAAG
jgi:hypothetical protein